MFYIIVRTFPFWAIPTAITLFMVWFRTHPNTPLKKRLRTSYMLASLVLIALSTAYLFFQGHLQAVPFVYEHFMHPNGDWNRMPAHTDDISPNSELSDD